MFTSQVQGHYTGGFDWACPATPDQHEIAILTTQLAEARVPKAGMLLKLKPYLDHRADCYLNIDLQGPRSCTCGLEEVLKIFTEGP